MRERRGKIEILVAFIHSVWTSHVCYNQRFNLWILRFLKILNLFCYTFAVANKQHHVNGENGASLFLAGVHSNSATDTHDWIKYYTVMPIGKHAFHTYFSIAYEFHAVKLTKFVRWCICILCYNQLHLCVVLRLNSSL